MSPDQKRNKRRLHRVVTALAAVVSLAYAARQFQPAAPTPVKIGRAGALPQYARCVNGVWFWVERDKQGPNRLVRADAAGMRTILMADLVHGYAVDEHHIAWIAHGDGHWNVMLAGNDGSSPHVLRACREEPIGLYLAGGKAYWLRHTPAPVADGDPFPPLLSATEVCAEGGDGSGLVVVGRLPESEDGQVLGAHGGSVYVAIYRNLTPGNLVIYRVGPNDRIARRVAGASGHPPAMLTLQGDLYWLASSRETMYGYCLHHLGPGGRDEALSDWLPTEGRLYETYRGVAYGDELGRPSIWPAGPHDLFPTPLQVADGYYAVAAGDHEALLIDTPGLYSPPMLYRAPLP